MSKRIKNEKKPRCRTQVQRINEGEFKGEHFVGAANMIIKFTNFNTKGKTDIQEWL